MVEMKYMILCNFFLILRLIPVATTFSIPINETNTASPYTLLNVSDSKSVSSNYCVSSSLIVSISSAQIPFDPFTGGIYTFSGTFNPYQVIKASKADRELEAVINVILEQKPSNVRAPRGESVVFYSGIFGNTKVVLEWLMEGGSSLSYHDCIIAIRYLVVALIGRQWLNVHPIQITISVGGYRKIRCTIEEHQGEIVDIDTHQVLSFSGQLYPERKLSAAGIRSALGAAVLEAQREGVDTDVPDPWAQDLTRQLVSLDINLYAEPAEPYPLFTFGDLLELLNAIRQFYQERGVWSGLWGNVYVNQNPKIDIGYIYIKGQLSSESK